MVIHSDHEFIHFSGVAKIKKERTQRLSFYKSGVYLAKAVEKSNSCFCTFKNIMDTNKLRFNKVYIHVEYCPI